MGRCTVFIVVWVFFMAGSADGRMSREPSGRLDERVFLESLLDRVGDLMHQWGAEVFIDACNSLAGGELFPAAFGSQGELAAQNAVRRDVKYAYRRMVDGLEVTSADSILTVVLMSMAARFDQEKRDWVERDALLALVLAMGAGIHRSAAGGDGLETMEALAEKIIPQVLGRRIPQGDPPVYGVIAVYVLSHPAMVDHIDRILRQSFGGLSADEP